MVSRVTTAAVFQKSISDFTGIQSDLADLRRQISTGAKADSFPGLGAAAGKALDVENILDRNQSFITNNKLAAERLRAMHLAVQQIVKVADELEDNIVKKRSANGAVLPLTELAKANLNTLETLLNAKIGNRFLFSGSKTDTAAVANLQTTNIIGGIATDSYYQGNNDDLNIQVSEEFNLKYGIRANAQGFKDVIAAAHKAIEGDTSGADSVLAEAFDLINGAISGVADLSNKIGNDLGQIEATISLQESTLTFFEKVQAENTGVDISVATTKVVQNETVLQASFQVLARLSQLRLANFLN